jgi:hypothetical protein
MGSEAIRILDTRSVTKMGYNEKIHSVLPMGRELDSTCGWQCVSVYIKMLRATHSRSQIPAYVHLVAIESVAKTTHANNCESPCGTRNQHTRLLQNLFNF